MPAPVVDGGTPAPVADAGTPAPLPVPDAGTPPPPPPPPAPDAGPTGGNGDAGTPSTTLAWDVTDLGAGDATWIDNAGRVGGSFKNPDGTSTNAIWTAGSGWQPVPVPPGALAAWPAGIDENGNLGLNAIYPWGRNSSYTHAWLAYPLRPFPSSVGTGQTSLINGVNLQGHMTGYDQSIGGAFFYDGSQVTPIAVVPGSDYLGAGVSQGKGINGHDQVAGWFIPSPGQYNSGAHHAFVWQAGTLTDLGPGDNGCSAEATAINDSGVVAGWVDIASRCGNRTAFYWDGAMHRVGCPMGFNDCMPWAINASGDILGYGLGGEAGIRAYLWHAGQFHLLEADGWTLTYATGLNDKGQIVGNGMHGSEGMRAFLLTPR